MEPGAFRVLVQSFQSVAWASWSYHSGCTLRALQLAGSRSGGAAWTRVARPGFVAPSRWPGTSCPPPAFAALATCGPDARRRKGEGCARCREGRAPPRECPAADQTSRLPATATLTSRFVYGSCRIINEPHAQTEPQSTVR